MLSYALRSLRLHPLFSSAVILTLVLGIGANTAIFSLVYAALLRPLPFPDSQRLAFVSSSKLQDGVFTAGLSYREQQEWAPQLSRVFDSSATIAGNREGTWTAAGQDLHLHSRNASASFFSLLGIRPLAGRLFTSVDTAAGHGAVAVLSYDLWQRLYAGDFKAIGQPLRKRDGDYPAYTVIGILPPSFEFDEPTDLWTPQQPLSTFEASTRVYRPFRLIGRLAPGVSLTQAQAVLDGLAAHQALAFPASNKGWGLHIVPLVDRLRANGRVALLLLWAAVACLLLIACANAANLLLARAGARRHEIAIRLAIGASRARVIAQLLTESAVLAAIGGALGWMVAAWSLRALRYSYLLPPSVLQDITRMHANALDPAVLAFTLLASVVAVLLFGLAPARSATMQADLSSRAPRASRASHFLVTAEVALVVVLTVGAGLLIRSLLKLSAVDPGFQTANRLTFDIELPRLPQSAQISPADNRRLPLQTQWLEELEQRLQSIPGVRSAGISNAFPLTQEPGGWGVQVGGRQLPPSTSMAFVTPGYFDAVGAPLLEGANFSPSTYALPGSKALIVNRTLANLLFPGESAVGRHVDAPRCGIDISRETRPSDCVIVGIAQDTRFSLDAPAPPTFYYSLHQDAGDRVTYVVRAQHDVASLIPQVRAAVSGMPPYNAARPYFFHLQLAGELLTQSTATPRFRGGIGALFATIALLLAAIGIYGVQAHAVTRRTREIGIRMAVGANPASVFLLFLRESAAWTILGIVIGLAAGTILTRFLAALLFGITRWDPVTFLLSPLLILAVALLATALPARQAMSVDPVESLRAE